LGIVYKEQEESHMKSLFIILTAALLLMPIFVSAGCGGNPSTSTPTTTSSAAPTTSPATSISYPGIGSQWVYTVTYSDPKDNCYNTTTRTWTVEALNVIPAEPTGASVMPASIPCVETHGDFGNAVRYFPPGIEVILQSVDSWYSAVNMVTAYGVEKISLAGGQQLTTVVGNTNYALTAGTNIGMPFTVGSAWTYDTTGEVISIAGSVSTKNRTVVVEANNQSVTLADGTTTVNDCVQVNTYDTSTETLLWTSYYSTTVKWLVKQIDYGDFNGTETMLLSSYSLAP
jgi:hypothetical protein